MEHKNAQDSLEGLYAQKRQIDENHDKDILRMVFNYAERLGINFDVRELNSMPLHQLIKLKNDLERRVEGYGKPEATCDTCSDSSGSDLG